MDLAYNIILTVVAIGFLIMIHEFGHFIAARLTGMRVDTFSIGMGPRLFGYNKVLGFTVGKLPQDANIEGYTDFRFAALPIGGYVKIPGMIDESMDDEFKDKEPQPWEFRSKNTFQKAFALSGGVMMNAILTVLIFAFIAFSEGESRYATTKIGYVRQNSIAQDMGFRAGDKVISVNGKKFDSWNGFLAALATDEFGENKSVKVFRAGEKVTLNIDGKKIVKAVADQEYLGFYPEGLKTIVLGVDKTMPAGKIDLRQGDTIVSINDQFITSNYMMIDIFGANKNKDCYMIWKRGDLFMADTVAPASSGKIGAQIGQIFTGPIVKEKYGVFESLAVGFERTVKTVDLFFASMAQMFGGNISFKQSVGGPVQIFKQASDQAELGFTNFISFVALISITLAIINILPFPALDGGHLVFVLIEGLFRREIPVNVKTAIQMIGVIAIGILGIYVLYNDISRLSGFELF